MHEDGYADMIGEDMYVDEMAAFLSGIDNPSLYPNSLDKDCLVLGLLDKIEKSDGGF